MNNEYEEILMKFGKELVSSNISGKSLRKLTDYIETTIDNIIEDYPEIEDTFVRLPNDDYRCRVDVTFVDGTEMTVSLGIETHYTATGEIRVY